MLIPEWAHHFDAFWDALKKRNLWFIKLRFAAAAVLALFLLTYDLILTIRFTDTQMHAFAYTAAAMLLYNYMLIRVRRLVKCEPGKFNPLHISLMQMVLDISALLILVHYMGSIESPLITLFVFHMIIGSLILPGKVMYPLAGSVTLIIAALTYLEYTGIITHQSVSGFIQEPLYTNKNYVISVLTLFAFVNFITVMITNRIANQLYMMEQQLVENLNKIKAAEKEKAEYIMGIVHEIKTPLSAVQSYLDLLLQHYLGPMNPEMEKRIKRARRRSLEGLEIINNVLKVSRIKLLDEIQKEPVDVKQLIVSYFRKTLGDSEIRMNIIDSRIDRKPVMGEPYMLELAFSNLLGNAVKYAGSRGKIEIRLEEEQDKLKVTIMDNGVGIPEADIGKIFTDFYRGSNIKQQKFEGVGFGLSIVKNIIQKHNGEIRVASPSAIGEPGHPGAEFTLFLPYT